VLARDPNYDSAFLELGLEMQKKTEWRPSGFCVFQGVLSSVLLHPRPKEKKITVFEELLHVEESPP
jgi:hypothetical protein